MNNYTNVPMQLFMYDAQMGKKINTGSSMKGILCTSLVAMVLILVVISIASSSGVSILVSIMCGYVALIGIIVVAIVHAYKGSVARTAYIYYNGILYKEILWGGQYALAKGGRRRRLKEFARKCKDPEAYRNLFYRYLNGEQIWSSISGGEGKIDALKNFSITGETGRKYTYTYIDEKGRKRKGKLLKCYPNIETVFKLCQ